jgi:hypothetical protein
MSRLTVVAAVLAVLVFGMGSAAQADPVSVGAMIRLYDGPGYNSGGEFYADVQPFDSAAPYDFITFCLQRNEYFSPGRSMYRRNLRWCWLAATDHPQTAYLCTSMRNRTLGAFSGTSGSAALQAAATATALQLAFWQLGQAFRSGVPGSTLRGLGEPRLDRNR